MITVNSGVQAATWAAERNFKYKLEVLWDGVNWTDESQYVKNITGFEELQGELGQSSAAELDVTLFNHNERFTPDNYSSPIKNYLRLKKQVRLQIGFGDIFSGSPLLVDKFYGIIESITPDELERTCSLHMLDKSRNFMDVKIRSEMFQNQRTDNLIRILSSGVETDIDFEEGLQQVNFAYFNDHIKWGRMQEIAEAEGGRIFYDFDTLKFWNRSHLNGQVPVENLGWFWWVKGITQSFDGKNVKNIIQVNASPREVQALQPVFTQESPQEFPSGRQLVFWAEFTDRDGSLMPILSLVDPSGANPDTTSYMRGNTAEDGSGTDISDQIVFAGMDLFATSAKIRLEGPPKAFLTSFQLWGIPAKIVNFIREEQTDLDSIHQYGENVLTIDNDYVDSREYAQSLSEELLKRYKDQRSNFGVKVLGIPYLQPGDVVEVQLTENRIDTNPDNDPFTLDVSTFDGPDELADGPPMVGGDFMIKSIRYYIGPEAGFYQDLSLINPYLPD